MHSRQALKSSIRALLLACLATSVAGIGSQADARLGLPQIIVPADNPLTPEKIALGKKLFMDRRLSPNKTLSCAMCHVPEQGFTQNELATSVGFEGKSLRRNAPTLLNVALHDSFQRDGAKASLEEQVWGPLLAANEMANGTVQVVVSRVKNLADYRGLFEAAFPGRDANQETIGQALASYERTLLAGDSRFDRWYFRDDATALSAEEIGGFDVFKRANCIACHTIGDHAAAFTDNRFHNTGRHAAAQQQTSQPISVQLAPGVSVMVDTINLANVSESTQPDEGRFEVTGDPIDRHAYKTPSLRNVALTAPYMHDGAIATLAGVIDFYVSAAGCAVEPRVELSLQDRRQLLAFLGSLTGANAADLAREARAAFANY